MLTSQWTSPDKIREWKSTFRAASPFRFLVIENAVEPKFAETLSDNFPSLQQMSVKYKGINEMKSEHSSFHELSADFGLLRNVFASEQLRHVMEEVAGIEKVITIQDRYGYGLHQGGRNSFLDIHVDYNLHPTEKKQRRLNLILFLNREWKEEWGGHLEFWNRDVSRCMQSIPPLFNRAVIFECNEYSYHGYSKISCPEGVTRKSFYHYYFSEPEQKLVFHDTIFKTKPQETTFRKVVVTVKETAKNLVKRSLYHLGLNRLLK